VIIKVGPSKKWIHPMLCPDCYGKGQVLEKRIIAEYVYKGHGDYDINEEVFYVPEPCPECKGYGVIHCCEGLTESEWVENED